MLLWHCLSNESQECLRKVLWRNHRKKLLPPGQIQDVNVRGKLESTEEIGQLMRMAKLRGEG